MATTFKKPDIAESDGIVLYCYPHNYYSQKALIALHEKHLEFQVYTLDVANGEQFSEWFIEMSPRGDIPVLQDGLFIIPETTKILYYLDHRYKVSENLLQNGGSEAHKFSTLSAEKEENYRTRLDKMPVGALTIGCFLHDKYCTKIKPPYLGPVRDALLAADAQLVTELTNLAIYKPELHDFFQRKISKLQRRRHVLMDEENFKIILNSIDSLLGDIEKDLRGNPWICGAHLTFLDISLGLFLQRIHMLGLEEYFWGKDKNRPRLEQYFTRFMERDSVKKSIPSSISTMKAIWGTIPSSYKYAVLAVGVSSVALASSVMLK
ncbi:ganglioside-induced differentiation-associated protein 1 [Culicoides brevitarsis]|uniref:ganglioside-induced differentiation-associated protein 1 n=1 Tax=Culicoides brevitarsis TaxID=469753 RepID=UPI00307C905C